MELYTHVHKQRSRECCSARAHYIMARVAAEQERQGEPPVFHGTHKHCCAQCIRRLVQLATPWCPLANGCMTAHYNITNDTCSEEIVVDCMLPISWKTVSRH